MLLSMLTSASDEDQTFQSVGYYNEKNTIKEHSIKSSKQQHLNKNRREETIIVFQNKI